MSASKTLASEMAEETFAKVTNSLPVVAKKSIYNISNQYLELMQRIEDNDGEMDEELSEALAINEKELTTKAVNYTYIMKEYEDEASRVDREIERLTKIKNRAVKNREDLKARISEAMQKYGIEKIESGFAKLYFKKTKALVIQDETKVPSGYLKTKETTTIDKAGLKKAVEAGLQFEGIWIQENMNLQIS